MYRESINELIKWKNSHRRKPMIIEGARQVGKIRPHIIKFMLKKLLFVTVSSFLLSLTAAVSVYASYTDDTNTQVSDIPPEYKEVLAIQIRDIANIGCATAPTGQSVTMLSFGGTCDNEYFKGAVMPGGIDCQSTENGTTTLSARYMLKGVDCAGDSCTIFIENSATANSNISKPKITTDSRVLAFLNDSDLVGILDNNGPFTIRILAPKYEAEPKLDRDQDWLKLHD